jgi:putative peptidoglycan lipid II flippase
MEMIKIVISYIKSKGYLLQGNFSSQIARATILMTIVAAICKVTGFIREMSFAVIYGISEELDVFLVAGVLPWFLAVVLQRGIITTFVPLYNEYRREGTDRAEQFCRTIFFAVFIISLLILIAGFIFDRQLVVLLAPGFNEGKTVLAVSLLHCLLPMVLILNLREFFSSFQQAHHIFLWTSLGPVVVNIVTVAGIWLMYQSFGIYAAAYASVAAAIFELLIQFPGIKGIGLNLRGKMSDLAMLKKTGKLMAPILFGVVLSQINVIIDRTFASSLPAGSIAVISYAQKIWMLSFAFFAAPLITAAFPEISKQFSLSENAAAQRQVLKVVIILLSTMVVISLCLVIFREVIVSFILERGNFDRNATMVTAQVLMCYCFGLIQYSLTDFLGKVFYCLHDTIIPLKAAFLSVISNIIMNFIFIQYWHMGASGLALGSTGGFTVGLIYMSWNLQKRFSKTD